MSMYTTGELAKACGVTVRTVQYYDTQDLLNPSELTEGGRRLYSEEDKQKMLLICTLRDLGLSLDIIRKIFQEENSREVVETFLTEQKLMINQELEEKKQQMEKIDAILQGIRGSKEYSIHLIGDMAKSMERRKKVKRLHWSMLVAALPMNLIEIGTIIYWIKTGSWIPFAIGMVFVVALGVWIFTYYFSKVSFICPDCHKIFRPGFRESFFAYHTPNTRKLTCPGCGHKSYCIETYREPEDEKN